MSRWGATVFPAEPSAAKARATALRWFVDYFEFETGTWWPGQCDDCPFEAPTREPHEDISNDLSEAHYLCPIFRKEIWGESPECRKHLFDLVKDVLREALGDAPSPERRDADAPDETQGNRRC